MAQCSAIGPWRIDPRELDTENGLFVASGSFGEVRTASFRGTTVAVKKMKKEKVTRENCMRFVHEVEICRSLRHPHIMQILGGCWDSADTLMIVTEYCEIGSLGRFLRHQGANFDLLGPKLRWLTEIAKAMCYLHGFSVPVLHRDLKADNILLNQSLQIKLSDFGDSRSKTIGEEAMSTVGSPFWMAPEVFLGNPYDEGCDVYSFAIVMLEVAFDGNLEKIFRLNGQPGRASIGLSIAHQVTQGWRPTIGESLLKRSTSLAELINLCWSQRSEERPQFARILDILHYVESCGPDDGSSTPMSSTTNSVDKFRSSIDTFQTRTNSVTHSEERNIYEAGAENNLRPAEEIRAEYATQSEERNIYEEGKEEIQRKTHFALLSEKSNSLQRKMKLELRLDKEINLRLEAEHAVQRQQIDELEKERERALRNELLEQEKRGLESDLLKERNQRLEAESKVMEEQNQRLEAEKNADSHLNHTLKVCTYTHVSAEEV